MKANGRFYLTNTAIREAVSLAVLDLEEATASEIVNWNAETRAIGQDRVFKMLAHLIEEGTLEEIREIYSIRYRYTKTPRRRT